MWTLEGCPEIAPHRAGEFRLGAGAEHPPGRWRIQHNASGRAPANGTVDFAFLDGNHRYEATAAYFRQLLPFTHEHSVLVFDDIHWSSEMRSAWEVIRQDPAVTISIDLYQFGIVFFRQRSGHDNISPFNTEAIPNVLITH